MKKIFMIFLTIITTLLFTGCGIFSETGITEPPEERAPGEQNSESEVPEYEIMEETDTLPTAIVVAIEHLKSRRGYFVFNPQDYATGKDVYVLISAGEKPTGGYLIEVNSLNLKNGTLEVVLEEKEPAAEDGVIQVITYPRVVIKIFDLYENFNVINQDNMKFEEISPENIPSISKESGIYIGQIDNNFIEIEVGGEAKAFMLAEQELIKDVNDGDKIFFEYFKDENESLVVRSIERAP